MTARRAAAAIAIAASLLATAAPAAAQPARPSTSALERFDAAQKLFDQGKRADALAIFQQVYEETKSPNARLMAARCLLSLGRTADGYDELYATMREAAAKAEREPKYAKTRDAAAAEIAMLEPKIGKIVVALAEPGATVTLNDVKLAAERLGVPLATIPGPVRIAATRPDGAVVRREEKIAAGETKTITLVFPAAPGPEAKPAPLPAPPVPVPEPPVRTGGGVRAAGIAIAGVGVVGMAVFGATFAVAQGKYDTLVNDCGSSRCTDPKYADVVDTGKRMELVSNVSLGIGAAALAAGGLMIILGGPKAKPAGTAGAWSIPSVGLSPYGAGVRLSTGF